MEQQFLDAYEKYADAIFRHCYFRVYNRELARDLVQETFTRAWNQISKGVFIENIRAFLYRVATNLIIDESRKKKAYSLDTLLEQGFSPAVDQQTDIEHKLEGQELMRIMRRLDDDDRQIVIMRYIDDLTPKEIAEILHLSENVASVRIHRAIKKVRKISDSREEYI